MPDTTHSQFYSHDQDTPPTNRFARILWEAEQERQKRRLAVTEQREKLNKARSLTYTRPTNGEDDKPIDKKRLEYIRQLIQDTLY